MRCSGARPNVTPRRNATIGNYLGRRSRIKGRPSVHLMTVQMPRIPTLDHEPSNYGSFGQQARISRYGESLSLAFTSRNIGRLPGLRGAIGMSGGF